MAHDPDMSHLLVVEDDPDIAALIVRYLERAGHRVDTLGSGSDVMPRLRSSTADLVILDLMLPGLDGLLVCQAMRSNPATAHIPIIMLTARGEEADRVAGLELGADDYVTKPFSPKELTARVTALLRRAGRTAASPLQRYGPITIDADKHHVALDGEEVRLTASTCCSTRVGCCRAISCSATSGATTTLAARARSTFTSAACARSCRR
jgi:DNA-binding response OmpR family regulator